MGPISSRLESRNATSRGRNENFSTIFWKASLGTDIIDLITVINDQGGLCGEGSFPWDKGKYLSHPRDGGWTFCQRVFIIRLGYRTLHYVEHSLSIEGDGPWYILDRSFPKGNDQRRGGEEGEEFFRDDTRREGKVVSRLRPADKDHHHHRSFGLS